MIRECFLEEINPKFGTEGKNRAYISKKEGKREYIKGSIIRRKNEVISVEIGATSVVHS